MWIFELVSTRDLQFSLENHNGEREKNQKSRKPQLIYFICARENSREKFRFCFYYRATAETVKHKKAGHFGAEMGGFFSSYPA